MNQTILLKDYKKSNHLITHTDLTFDLDEEKTLVKSRLTMERIEEGPLVLNGKNLKLLGIQINGIPLSSKEYQVEENLTVFSTPKKFTLEIENTINPSMNKALCGLYQSGELLCTQNEAEGFRRITYYLDRPDVMAIFSTKIIADKTKYPILLSNGNLEESKELPDNRHFVRWEDPFKKPCYLFALVAGNLGVVQDSFTTMTNRKIDLRLYCDKGSEHLCDHALRSLKEAMKWDEDTYGLEYDLDIYMIVAVAAFNMGAMENKGLNIFNSSYILANPQTATDRNYLGIQSVVAHEYFHNWTGNRVTCRDWFQLTLKEGLTVFRDQKFSAQMNSVSVQRISDVDRLRENQFPEDAGPTSHPIQPASYMQIENFYTPTVYEKGAEVIKMIETFLGEEGFRRGMDKYFELYDGQAVTTDDFIHAMSEGSGFNLDRFKLWYSQAGTPRLELKSCYENNIYTLKVKQFCPPTPESETKKPFYFPFRIGLIDREGNDLPIETPEGTLVDQGILTIKKEEETFLFKVDTKPLISLNRNFTAPVKWSYPYSDDDLAFLMASDKDDFARYEACQEFSKRLLLNLIEDKQNKKELSSFIRAYGQLLLSDLDPAFLARCMSLPSESTLHQEQNTIDFTSTHEARQFVLRELAKAHRDILLGFYDRYKDLPYRYDQKSMGERSLKNSSLGLLMQLEDTSLVDLCYRQFEKADNMTDSLASLMLLSNMDCDHRKPCLERFYKTHENSPLVLQRWMMIQAASRLPDTFNRVKNLLSHPKYDKTIPNFVRSVVYSFASNYIHFHREDGEGYRFIVEQIMDLDSFNPNVAAGLAEMFMEYERLPRINKRLAKEQLEYILKMKELSSNTCEIVTKILISTKGS